MNEKSMFPAIGELWKVKKRDKRLDYRLTAFKYMDYNKEEAPPGDGRTGQIRVSDSIIMRPDTFLLILDLEPYSIYNNKLFNVKILWNSGVWWIVSVADMEEWCGLFEKVNYEQK